MGFFSIWRAFWRDLNTPEDFIDQPYFGFINQVGHIALGRYLVEFLCAIGTHVTGSAPNAWSIAAFVVAFYLIVIELGRQRSFGIDMLNDVKFVAIGAVCLPMTASLTPSGRWARVDEWSASYLIWLSCACLALALYVWPRARRKWAIDTVAK